ncbi:MAG: SAM-dependent methyltransferase [Planctomycetaceae bacterium]
MPMTLTQALEAAVRGQTLVKLVLSAPQADSTEALDRPPTRFTIRTVQLKDRLQLQWTARTGSKEVHENLPLKESLVRLESLFPQTYREANLLTTEADAQFRSRNGKTVKARQKSNQRAAPPVSHNRTKNYLIPEGQPCPFLEAIGVMTPDGRVKASMTHKFHQINRFLELVNDILPHLPAEGPIRVVDFGSGKSYLTFALHHLLVGVQQREVEILAIDQNAEVIDTCRGLCERLQLSGIEFAAQSIASVEQSGPVHLAVALHACDGATDQALAQAVRWKSDVILAVPCCQHEVAKSIESAPLELLLRHGILKERFSALATDAMRAAALDTAGYKTQILEFIDLDHTPKNLLIRAVKRREGEASATTSTAYAELKAHLGLGTLTIDQIPNAGSP